MNSHLNDNLRLPLYCLVVDDRRRGRDNFLTYVSPDEFFEKDQIPSRVILGKVEPTDDGIDLSTFKVNGAFLEYLHAVIRETVPKVDEFKQYVQGIDDGWFNVNDGRSTLGGDPLPGEDLIGQYRVLRGEFVEREYRPNDEYKVVTSNGPPTLHPALREVLLNEWNSHLLEDAPQIAVPPTMISESNSGGDSVSISQDDAIRHDALVEEAHRLLERDVFLDGESREERPGWFARRRLKKAERLFREALEINPTSWTSVFLIGKIFQRLGNLEEAFVWMKAANKVVPEDISIAKEVGAAAIDFEECDFALIVMERAIESSKPDGPILSNLGLCYLLTNQSQKAQSAFERSLVLEPGHVGTQTLLRLSNEVQGGRVNSPISLQEIESFMVESES